MSLIRAYPRGRREHVPPKSQVIVACIILPNFLPDLTTVVSHTQQIFRLDFGCDMDPHTYPGMFYHCSPDVSTIMPMALAVSLTSVFCRSLTLRNKTLYWRKFKV